MRVIYSGKKVPTIAYKTEALNVFRNALRQLDIKFGKVLGILV